MLGLSKNFINNCVFFLNEIDYLTVVDSFTLVLAHRHTLNFVNHAEQPIFIDQAVLKIGTLVEKEVYVDIVQYFFLKNVNHL